MQRGQQKLRYVNHLMILLNGNVSLLKRITDVQYEIIETIATPAKKEPYILCKTLSHYAVRLHMALDGIIKGDINLLGSAEKLSPLRADLMTLKLNYPNQVKMELAVIDLTLSIIDQASSCVSMEELKCLSDHYLKVMASHHERYGRQATEHQLKGLEEITSKWLEEYSVDLKSTYIVIVGTRGPKKGMIEKQYFQSLRAREGIKDVNTPSHGMVYSEMLAEQIDKVSIPALLNDLARDLLSQDIAEGMLDNREGMHEDVLSRHAQPVLAMLEKSKLKSAYEKGCGSAFWKPQKETKSHPSYSKCPFSGLVS